LSRGLCIGIGMPLGVLLFDTGDERDVFDDGVSVRYI
jgi:hypothetical protein